MRGRSFHTGVAAAAIALVSSAALLSCDALVSSAAAAGEIDVFADDAPASQPATAQSPDRTDAATAPNDPTTMDALVDEFAEPKSLEPLRIDRADWLPEHARTSDTKAPGATKAGLATKPSGATRILAAAKATGPDAAGKAPHAPDDIDPEPDGEVTVPSAAPSNDPLDKPKAAQKAGDAPDQSAKDQATKDEATKDEATKDEASKDQASKDQAAKDHADPNRPGTDQAGKPADQPLPPLNAAIKAALDKRDAEPKGTRIGERRKEREAIAFFYAAHGFAPTWSANGKAGAAVDSVLARLARADEDALTLPATPNALKTDGTPAEIAESDIALTEAVVAYARQATGARVDPRGISPLIGAKPALADPAEIIDRLNAAGTQAGAKLLALNPVDPRYAALRGKLADMRGPREAETDKKIIPPGPTLKLGMRDARVPLLRARFGLDAPLGDAADARIYDEDVVDAVRDFQRANGLPASGTLNQKTVAALSGAQKSPAKLEGAIIANMEMWRWMPRDLGSDRIEVNVPAYLVTVFHDNEAVATNRVVVGKTDTPTPLFSNTMKFLIVNPLWNVPQSIIQKEMLPKGGGDLSYLQGRGYNVSYKHGQVTVQQESGAKNALGRIKFMFPNDYSVYLHDTPSKNFFQASRRAFSHGCVRVDKPFDFAESVLNDGVPEGGKILWSQARLQKMLGDKERYVYLPKPLPIHIEYFTASVDPDSGKVQTREDIYGYAHAVASALGKESDAPPPRVAEKKPAPERKPKRVAETYPRRAAADVPPPDPYTQSPSTTGSTGGGLFGWFGR